MLSFARAPRLFSLWPLFFIFLAATSCSPKYEYYCVEGVEEFVLDSYRIREGKLSILEMQGHEIGDMPDDAMDEYKDTIAEDDILNIIVYHPSRSDLMQTFNYINHSIGFLVRDGRVDIPDIAPVEVIGLTLEEARIKLQEECRKHVRDIELFITYRDRLSRKIDLMGLVSTSTIPVDGKLRLYEALSRARVPANACLFMSYVSRNGSLLPVDLHQLIAEGNLDYNIVMKGGDKIYIADSEQSRVMIMGEVLHPRPIDTPKGFISLREAIVFASGIPYTGDKQHIQVIRGNVPEPKIYVLAWEHIVHLPNDSLLLMPGDTVYVSEKPITRWNRFISQLLPSFQGVQTGFGTYRTVGLGW